MDDIRNFIQMTDKIGTSGQPTPEQFEKIAAADYKAVINLAMPNSTHAIPDEGTLVSRAGMHYVHIPVPWENPTAEHLKSFIRIMRAYDGEKVWVHCALNMRVSAFMHQYLRIEKGWSDAAASNTVLNQWAPEMAAEWKRFLSLSAEDLV